MRVDLRKWMRANAFYVSLWIIMGLVCLGLVVWEIGINTLAVIAPFLVPFIIAMAKMGKELRKR